MEKNQHKTRDPIQKRSIKTKEKILWAATSLFSEKGFHKTNTKEIAAQAGVAIGSFYAYFKDKKSVFLEIYQSCFTHEIFPDTGQDDFSDQSNKEMVLALLNSLSKAHTLSADFQREVSAMRYTDRDVGAIHNKIHESMRSQLIRALKKHRKKIRTKDLEAAAFVILCACEEVIHSGKVAGNGIPLDRLLDNLADMIARFVFKSP